MVMKLKGISQYPLDKCRTERAPLLHCNSRINCRNLQLSVLNLLETDRFSLNPFMEHQLHSCLYRQRKRETSVMDDNKLKTTARVKIEFDFDHWADLWKSDPVAFEVERTDFMEKLIASAPARQQRRLRGLLFEVDAIRSTSACPLKACIRISELMWKSFYQMRQLISEDLRDSPQQQSVQGADILHFHRNRDRYSDD